MHLIASEANEICEKENRKTMTGEHIIKAVESLAFNEYLQDLKTHLTEYDSTAKVYIGALQAQMTVLYLNRHQLG